VFNTNPQQLWRAEFKSEYLEEICRKTGNHMTYPDFNKTLQKAFDGLSSGVFVDLLNLSDLQMLKGGGQR
jgi:hypothetical protein